VTSYLRSRLLFLALWGTLAIVVLGGAWRLTKLLIDVHEPEFGVRSQEIGILSDEPKAADAEIVVLFSYRGTRTGPVASVELTSRLTSATIIVNNVAEHGCVNFRRLRTISRWT